MPDEELILTNVSHTRLKYNLFRTMASDFSSDYEGSTCLGSPHRESECNPFSYYIDSDSSYSRSRKKSEPSAGRSCFLSHYCSTRPGNDNKKDSVSLSSEEESSVRSSQNNPSSRNSEGIARKIGPWRELTIEELVREFGDNWKFQPNSMSVGHFRDQVVMKFRRALYYSGIWVTHVQGNRFVEHFSANYFKRNPGCLHRLVPWLKRELTAVYGDYSYTVKNLLSTILHHMTEYDLDSESFIHLLEPYLQQHTHHFLHEFINFVHSPYNMETYDQRAIYKCSSSPWVKKKLRAFVPVFSLLKDQALLASQHNTRESENTCGQWSNQQRPLSSLKEFPNGNSSLKGSEIPLVHHKRASKIHAWSKDKPESGDHKVTVSTDNMLVNWAIPTERGSDLQNCKQNVHKRKMEGIKVLPGHVQDLGEGETAARTFSSPAIFHQEKQWKYSLRGRKVLSLGQHMNVQKKEAEKNRHSDSSPKTFQRQLTRGRSLLRCKATKRDPSWSCTSENALSFERHGRKLSSFRKRRTKGRQSSQSAEVGSHSGRRLQRQPRSSTRRSRSWCVRLTKRSVSTESRNPSLRGSHRSECFTKHVCCEPSKENNVYHYESNHRRASSATVQYMHLPSTAGKKPECPSKREGTSQAGSHCNSPPCPQIEKYRSPSKQERKQKNTFPRPRKTRAVRHKNNKGQCPDIRAAEELSDEKGDLHAIRQVSSLSECVLSCRRQKEKELQSSEAFLGKR